MKLSELLSSNPKIQTLNIDCDPEILGISFDSRRLQKGDIFFCKGENFKPEYAFAALKGGALAVCFENKSPYAREIVEFCKKTHPQAAILQADNIKQAMAQCSDIFYRHPFSEIKSIAVTGTKGKTSTVQMICDIINQVPSFRGAILNDFLPNGAPPLTTPEAPDLFFAAQKCTELGYTHIVCEISSQAVKEARIFGINFDIACFLNFGHDHISPFEHKDEQEYFDCKKQLFLNCRCALLNADCPKSDEIIRTVKENDMLLGRKSSTKILTFGFDSNADFKGENLQKNSEGCSFSVKIPKKSFDICVTNNAVKSAQNALCASAVGAALGVSEREIFTGIAISRVEGRMERILSFDRKIEIIIDYAHNKMSFEAVFSYAKELGRPITAVFGCPGSKAFCRRSELPEIALRYADRIILTEDDSGDEGFSSIKSDILKNISAFISANPELQRSGISAKISVNADRKAAIEGAIASAAENNESRTILVLGKGCEQTMRCKNGAVFYKGDQNIAKNALENYTSARETALILANAGVFSQKVTLLLSNEGAIDNLFFALDFLPSDACITSVCPENLLKYLRSHCFKHGRQEKIFNIAQGEKFSFGDGIRFYIAPENNDLARLTSEIAVQSGAKLLAYIVSARGIMLNGTGFVKRLSLGTARLIQNHTQTPYISHLISALDSGVSRCAVVDSSLKTSFMRLAAGLEFSGSEIN